MKYIIVWTLLVSLLFSINLGRENPFISATHKHKTKEKKLTTHKIYIEANVKEIKNIVFDIKDTNGSISRKSVKINKMVVPNSYIFLMQSNKSKDKILSLKPVKSKTRGVVKPLKVVKFFNFLKVKFYKNHIVMIHRKKDIMIHNYTDMSKNIIAIKFEQLTTFGKTKEIAINRGIYKSIKIGDHKTHYQVVVTLNRSFKKVKIRDKSGKLTLTVQ